MKNSTKRIIVAGMGSIGIRHARVCGRLEGWSVELCDPRPEGLAEARSQIGDLPAWTSYEEALRSRPEIVIIASPHHLHAEMACAAMEAGIDVLCEKPMSDTLEGARRMADCARTTGRTFRVGFMLRFHPVVEELRRLWRSGGLGEVLSVRYTVGSLQTLEFSRSRYQGTQFGAAVMDYVHGIDLLLWLTGKIPAGVYARGLQAGNLPLSSNPNVFTAIADYADPLLAEIHIDYATKPEVHEFTAQGDRATARVDLPGGTISLAEIATNAVHRFERMIARDDLYFRQIQKFIAARDQEREQACTAEEGLLSNRMLTAFLKSLREERRVAVP